jgi:hypothetical protein
MQSRASTHSHSPTLNPQAAPQTSNARSHACHYLAYHIVGARYYNLGRRWRGRHVISRQTPLHRPAVEDDRATVLKGRNGQAQVTHELYRQIRVAQRDEHALIPLCDMFLPALENIIRGCPLLAVSSSAIPPAHYLTAQIGCHDIELCHTQILNHRQPCVLFSPSKQVGRAGPCPEAWKGG